MLLGGQPIKAYMKTSKHMSLEGLNILSSFLLLLASAFSCFDLFLSVLFALSVCSSYFLYFSIFVACLFSGSLRSFLFLYLIHSIGRFPFFIFRGLRPCFLLTGNLMLVRDLRCQVVENIFFFNPGCSSYL